MITRLKFEVYVELNRQLNRYNSDYKNELKLFQSHIHKYTPIHYKAAKSSYYAYQKVFNAQFLEAFPELATAIKNLNEFYGGIHQFNFMRDEGYSQSYLVHYKGWDDLIQNAKNAINKLGENIDGIATQDIVYLKSIFLETEHLYSQFKALANAQDKIDFKIPSTQLADCYFHFRGQLCEDIYHIISRDNQELQALYRNHIKLPKDLDQIKMFYGAKVNALKSYQMIISHQQERLQSAMTISSHASLMAEQPAVNIQLISTFNKFTTQIIKNDVVFDVSEADYQSMKKHAKLFFKINEFVDAYKEKHIETIDLSEYSIQKDYIFGNPDVLRYANPLSNRISVFAYALENAQNYNAFCHHIKTNL